MKVGAKNFHFVRGYHCAQPESVRLTINTQDLRFVVSHISRKTSEMWAPVICCQ
jgi:hypothetical protein